ncbi:MAG: hypothetical protein FP825_16985 [Hyphomonas sp.]|uniref:hypothetical protein n=1 Tax=Hyphomonas sp. TaxID=87 RepID=UPI00182EE766|nr:hypothetical protein [Hyphomonas sp.]MBA3070165.1 hypothetical protein [Hyphomonas sp.]MBU3920124.1 hypothetical protein [Alphaproteobacteria bacterium]MBU4060259.1 hypothetical protein [Alphaproteobacteria bacterium]MBU4162927.1 hypothetical protein [Alphaproteobacteria bacterium]
MSDIYSIMRSLIVLGAFAVLHAQQAAEACFAAPAHVYQSHENAIDSAEWIAIAEPIATQAQPDGYSSYRMRALEYVKGSGPAAFIVPNADQMAAQGHSKEQSEGNYYAHTVSRFWTEGGSYSNWSDCRIHPEFLYSGHKYLVFGPLDYNVGFENITGEEDEWLKYVRARVSGQPGHKPYPIPFQTYLDQAAAVLRVKVWWDGTSSQWTETVRKGVEANYLNMAYVAPQVHFDSRISPNCKELFSYGDRPTELDFLMVFERMPERKVRKSDYLECVGGDLGSYGSASAHGLFSLTGFREFPIVDDQVVFSKGESGYWGNWGAPTLTEKVLVSELEDLLK